MEDMEGKEETYVTDIKAEEKEGEEEMSMTGIKIEAVEGEEETYVRGDQQEIPTDISTDEPSNRDSPERCPRPSYSQYCTEENHRIPQEDQGEGLTDNKVEDIEGETYVRGDQQCKEEEIPAEISTDGPSNRDTPERCPRPLYSLDHTEENHRTPLEDQCDSLADYKIEYIVGEEEAYVMGDQQCKEEAIPRGISTDCATDPIAFPACQSAVRSLKTSSTVQGLKSIQFSRLTLAKQCEVKKRGRPTPLLDIKQRSVSRKKEYTRNFNLDIYKNHEWLCGCDVQNALFCFPCLLFGGDAAWTDKGISDLKRLNEKIKKHTATEKHVNNSLNLALLGSVSVRTCISDAHKEMIERHNAQVHKNREILSRIINCIKFCGINELALWKHDDGKESEDPGTFVELLKYTSEIDSLLTDHLASSSTCNWTSKSVQNDLLACMLDVYREYVLEEVMQAEFIGVMADETTDVTSAFQLALVLRYCDGNGNPVERFWGFFVPTGQDANAISECILSQLDVILKSEKHKLIGQSYDGAAAMSVAMNGVQMKVREIYRNAHFVHCFAHRLNLTMERAARQNTRSRIFFANLSAIPAFFSRSPHRSAVLNSCAAKRMPCPGPTRWNFRSWTVNVVWEKKDALLECFQTLEKSETSSNTTINEASALIHVLGDPEFNFWLNFFHTVTPHVDILHKQMQNRRINVHTARRQVAKFVNAVIGIRAAIDENTEEAEPSRQNKRRYLQDNQTRAAAAREVCDVIITQANTRFQIATHLQVSVLLCAQNYGKFRQSFPEKELQECMEVFPFFEKEKLRTELAVLYFREEFRDLDDAVQLLQFLLMNNLQSSFSEVVKLLRIAVTLPLTSAKPEHSYACLKRIKTYLQNTMKEERLSALAVLSVEKSVVMKNIPDFNNRVIEKFSTYKSRRMELICKY
ncbi:zinc finger MYM-type protein 1-like isoform X2 [Pseudophryne corroboree]